MKTVSCKCSCGCSWIEFSDLGEYHDVDVRLWTRVRPTRFLDRISAIWEILRGRDLTCDRFMVKPEDLWMLKTFFAERYGAFQNDIPLYERRGIKDAVDGFIDDLFTEDEVAA